MKDVTDTVSPALMAKVKAWGSTLKVTEMGGGLYIAQSAYTTAHANTAGGAVHNWLWKRTADAVNAANHANAGGSYGDIVTLDGFFRAHPEVRL